MGDFAKLETVGVRTYYVLQYGGGTFGWFIGKDARNPSDSRGTPSATEAQRFSSVSAILAFMGKSAFTWTDTFWRIVQITETPGTRQVRLVSKTKIDATKPVVFFHPEKGYYGGVSDGTGWFEVTLDKAAVYPDLGEALDALNIASRDKGRRFIPVNPGNVHIHQVEYITAPATITETVLA